MSDARDIAFNAEKAVIERYAAASAAREEKLCCPVSYDPKYLAVIPDEIIERDYGCGDPSRYVRTGDAVLDLGCGGGKICYIASQIVGPEGRVIGVDFNPAMLALARRHQDAIARRIGWNNVSFRMGRIQDLRTDYEALARFAEEHPVSSLESLMVLDEFKREQRIAAPLVKDKSVDVIVSNCVLNLVAESDRIQLFAEMFRVLRPGGRIAVSDIVADKTVPAKMRQDSELWSGCIAGAFEERQFLEAFEAAGFESVSFDKRDEKPWRVVEGIEFRAATVIARKPGGDSNVKLVADVTSTAPKAIKGTSGGKCCG
jgi:SAM-dependent methyltransferase